MFHDKTAGGRALCLVSAALLLGACGSLPSSSLSLVNDSAAACARVARWEALPPPPPRDYELCSHYVDLRLMQDLERRLADRLTLSFTPLPCLADGPSCGWQQDYAELVRARFEVAFADPTPQPSTPLPFDQIPASVQLEKAQSLRGGLLEAVAELDRRIELLSAAASPQ
jgi:hypothetical protein